MRDYVRIEVVNANQVDNYLAQGYEIIETTKESFGDGSTSLKYHVGMSARTLLHKYAVIIEDYEKHGFKNQLFKKVAESYGKDVDDYEKHGWLDGVDEVSKYMTNYDKVLKGSDSISYGIKHVKNYEGIDVNEELDF